MDTPEDRKYSKEHEWVLVSGEGVATIGITFFAQDQLGDVVYVDLPPVGTTVAQFGRLGEIESVKTVSNVYSAVTGTVLELNENLVGSPELVNTDPYENGWLVRVKVTDQAEMDQLLDSANYDRLISA